MQRHHKQSVSHFLRRGKVKFIEPCEKDLSNRAERSRLLGNVRANDHCVTFAMNFAYTAGSHVSSMLCTRATFEGGALQL